MVGEFPSPSGSGLLLLIYLPENGLLDPIPHLPCHCSAYLLSQSLYLTLRVASRVVLKIYDCALYPCLKTLRSYPLLTE